MEIKFDSKMEKRVIENALIVFIDKERVLKEQNEVAQLLLSIVENTPYNN